MYRKFSIVSIDIKKITFSALTSEKDKVSKNEKLLSTDIGDVKIDPPLQEGEIDPESEHANMSKAEPIKLELYINDMDSLNFGEILKEKRPNGIVFLVEAQIQTSWGKIDPMFNFIYSLVIDASSGEVLEISELSGS